jgi:hypothetical protein
VLHQPKHGQLRPGVVEPGVITVDSVKSEDEVVDSLLQDPLTIQGEVALVWEGIGVERKERVSRPNTPQRIFQGQEAWKVIEVGYQSRPNYRCQQVRPAHPMSRL